MKKILLLMAALLIGVSSLFAQNVKLDKEAIKKKIAASNTEISNPKKNTKSATWLNRGKVFIEAATALNTGWYSGMDDQAVLLFFGKSKNGKTKMGDVEYVTKTFPDAVAYMVDGKVVFWEIKEEIEKDALKTAFEAYQKAYELDPKEESKVVSGIKDIANAYKLEAQNLYGLQKNADAADAFRNAYTVQMAPPSNFIDTLSMYNAGFIYTFAREYAKGEESLELAVKNGYENEGEAQYFLFHCYFGQEKVDEAEEVLKKGLEKYPNNARIIESLMGLYTTLPDKNPTDMIPIVQKAIAGDDKNPDLWLGLGRAYDKLEDTDKAIEAFMMAVKLAPKNFMTNFNLGYTYINKGNQMSADLSKSQSTSAAELNKAIDDINNVFFLAIEPLEQAHKADPKNTDTIELLKNVTFRLRERSPEIAEKNKKYDEMFKAL